MKINQIFYHWILARKRILLQSHQTFLFLYSCGTPHYLDGKNYCYLDGKNSTGIGRDGLTWNRFLPSGRVLSQPLWHQKNNCVLLIQGRPAERDHPLAISYWSSANSLFIYALMFYLYPCLVVLMIVPDMDSKRRPSILNILDPPNPQNKLPHRNLAVQIICWCIFLPHCDFQYYIQGQGKLLQNYLS